MNLSKPLTTAAIFGSIAVALIVLHFLGLIGPEPQPIWPFDPEPVTPAEFFTVARGFISGVIWTAVIASITQMIRDAVDGAVKTVVRDYAVTVVAWVVAKVKGLWK